MTFYETRFLEYLDDNGLDIFNRSVINEIDTISADRAEIALRSLVNKGLIKIVERGKYCRHYFADEYVIGSFIVRNGGIAYWTAMNYHGLTEQIPNVVFIQTNQWKQDKTIFGVKYKFIQVKADKLTGYLDKGYGNHQFRITDIEKTIVDCFDMPEYSGGYPEIIKAFHHAKINSKKLIKYCKAINNIAVTKRLAYLSELLGKPNMDYFVRYALSVRNKKYNPLIHYGDKSGYTNRRWRLIINISEQEMQNMAKSI
jgi:predicted transcriptional regulator of viral defense system